MIIEMVREGLFEKLEFTDMPLQIIVMNLKRRRDRLFAWYGATHSAFVPVEAIHVFEGYDGLEYVDMCHVISEAQKDFSFWGKLADDNKWIDAEWIDAEWIGKGSLAVMWSMQVVLSAIARQRNGWYILTCDHFFVKANYKDWLDFFGKLDFDILQLHWWHDDKTLLCEHFPSPVDGFPDLSHGFAGAGDAIFAVTPEGANRLLDWWSEHPYHVLEVLLHEKSMINDKVDLEYCYSLINQWDWIGGQILLEKYSGMPDSDRMQIDGIGKNVGSFYEDR